MTTPVPFRRTSGLIVVFAIWMGNPASAAQFGDFTYTDDGTSITITDYPTTAVGVVEIPAAIVGKAVTGIGYQAFYYCTGLTGVTIPSSVKKIGDYAFASCSGLPSASIPDSVATIENNAFAFCTGLTSITLPSGYHTIGANAFNGCSSLTSVKIRRVSSIGNGAFANCSSLMNAYFLGNSPGMGTQVFDNAASGFAVHYFNGKQNFTTPTWLGYPSVNMGGPNPVVSTGSTQSITATSAILLGTVKTNGAVMPSGAVVSAWFKYGTTAAHGSTASVTLLPNMELSLQTVGASIGGLEPGRIYHYRIVCESGNQFGPIVIEGEDMTFGTNMLLTATATNGTVSGAGQYTPFSNGTLTATPSPGYLFNGWTGDATGTDNPLSLLMDSNKTVGASFTPDTKDTDDDGWTNYEEIVIHGTNPILSDTDGDNLKDSKDAFPLNPAETLDTDHDGTGDNADTDDDGDGLSDTDEITIHGTNPKRADSDGDGLSDPAEIQTHLTNPNIADTDSDGLNDGAEVNTYGTLPKVGDTDGDGFLDGYEVLTGKLPLDLLDKPALVAEARTAIEFIFPAAIGKTYRIEASTDLTVWGTVESGIVGTGGQVQRFYSILNLPKRYFRVEVESP